MNLRSRCIWKVLLSHTKCSPLLPVQKWEVISLPTHKFLSWTSNRKLTEQSKYPFQNAPLCFPTIFRIAPSVLQSLQNDTPPITTQCCLDKLLKDFYYTPVTLKINLNTELWGRGRRFMKEIIGQVTSK